jgi:hypothetical protein
LTSPARARGRWALVVLATAVVALATRAAAAGAASTRAEYVAQVEPICERSQKPTIKAYTALFRGLKKAGLVGDDPNVSKRTARRGTRLLGTTYMRVSSIYARTTAEIATVSAAPGDEASVANWLAGRNRAAQLGAQAGRAAKHQKVGYAIRLVDRGVSVSEEGAKSVAGYGFKFCALPLGEAESD